MKIEKIPVKCPYCDRVNYFMPDGYGVKLADCETEEGGCGAYFACRLSVDESSENGMLTYKSHSAIVSFIDTVDSALSTLIDLARSVPEGYNAFVDYSGHVDQIEVHIDWEPEGAEGNYTERRDRIFAASTYLDGRDDEHAKRTLREIVSALTSLPPEGPIMAEEVA